jgi:hypothetical protein
MQLRPLSAQGPICFCPSLGLVFSFVPPPLFFWWDWGLNSGLHIYKVKALLLESHLQSILLWLF